MFFGFLCSMFLLVTINCFAAEPLDHIIAVVNDDVITAHDFETHFQSFLARQDKKPAMNSAKIRKEILQQMINQRLQYQIADEEDIHVSDEEVARAIQKMAQSEHLSTEDFIQKIVKTGLTKSEFLEQIKIEMTVNRLQQQEITAKIIVSEEEINHYLITLYRMEKMKGDGNYSEEEFKQLAADENTRAELHQIIAKLKFEQKFHQWLDEQRANAYIKIYDKTLM